MKRTGTKHKSRWRQVAILLTISVISIFLIVTALFAEPDSTKPAITSKLQEGVFVQTDTTHRPPNPVSLKALERLQANSTEKWNVQWDEKTGLPGIGSGKIKGEYQGTPEEIAVAFIKDYKGLFLGIADSQLLACYTLEATRTQTDRQIGTSVKVQSKFKGVNIWKSHTTVILSIDGGIEAVYNFLNPIMLTDVTPTLSVAQVEEIIRRTAAPDSVRLPSEFGAWLRSMGTPAPDMTDADSFELAICPGSPPQLVYFGFRYVNYEPYRYAIDAHTGEILSQTFWGNRSQVREGDILIPGSRPATDSTATPSPIHPVPIPVFPSPDRDEGVTDSLLPQDTAGRSYYLEPRRGRRDETAFAPLLPKKIPDGPHLQTAATEAHFYEYNIEFEPGGDYDGDGYYRTYYAQWDADTWDDTAFVGVGCMGWTEPGNEYELFCWGPTWIWGFEADIWSVYFQVPYKGEWSFRLDLHDSLGGLLDQYPEYPEVDTIMVDEPMETVFEDLDYLIGNAMAYECLDVDNDGFAQLDSIFWRLTIEDYDTVDPLGFRLRIYAKEISGREFYITQTEAFYQWPGTTLWWYTLSPGWHEDQFDFRLELLSSSGEIVAGVAYDHFAGLVDLPMELWIEDPPMTMVFDPNPIVTLNDYYYIDIDTLMDHGDSVYPALINALQPCDLLGLTPDFYNVYYLDGPFVTIGDWQPAATQQAASVGDAVFPYYRCEPQFEEVMCYYHIDRSQRYLQELGFNNAYNTTILVDAHGLANLANGKFIGFVGTGTGVILFGDGLGVDFGEDADAILHEYGHAIQNNQAPDIYLDTLGGDVGFGNESLFMSEGFAFYWAVSNTDSVSRAHGFIPEWYGEWAAKGNMPVGEDDSCLYNIGNMRYYPDDMVTDSILEPDYEHLNGMIWAGTLWDIFQALGKRVADSLVLRSHELMDYYEIEDPVFGRGARMILTADTLGYNAAHHDELCNIFEQRGIFISGGYYKAPGAVWSCETFEVGDVNCDYGINPLDVAFLVNRVYRGWDVLCDDSLGDVDCSGGLTPLDVTHMVNYVYKYWPFPC